MRLTDDELRDVLARAAEIERTARYGPEWNAEIAAVIGAAEEVGLSRQVVYGSSVAANITSLWMTCDPARSFRANALPAIGPCGDHGPARWSPTTLPGNASR